jgi:agmatinase
MTDLANVEAAFAFLGVPYGVPYDMRGVWSEAATAPDAIRSCSWDQGYAQELHHFDFDLGGPLMPSGDANPAIVDCGDVRGDPRDLERTRERATEAVRRIIAAGAMPLVVGGDDSIPPLVVRAFEGHGTLNLLHVDAHIDFREEVRGVRDGYSSPIRRIRGLPWIGRVVQVGMRGTGSARRREVDEALAAGNVIVPASVVHDEGIAALDRHLVDDAPWFVSIDVDGLDPSVAPGTGYPEPGGLTFRQVAGLIDTIGLRGLLAGVDVTEIYPSRDVRGLTALVVLRLLMRAIGTAVRGSGDERRVLPF